MLHISWLRQHSAVACVHVPRGAGSKIAFVAPRAAEEAHRLRHAHRELHRGRQRCVNDKHRELLARSCSRRTSSAQGTNPLCPHRSSGSRSRQRAAMRPGRCLCPPPCGTLFLCRTPAPLAHLKDVLPDALRGGRTRRRRGQGGSGARAAAPECLGVLLWRYGHIDHPRGWCEVARGRCNGRSCTYSSGPETLVPLSPTHGPSVCTWRHYQTLKVTSVFNICRLGDAVVSGPRETRPTSTTVDTSGPETTASPGRQMLNTDVTISFL